MSNLIVLPATLTFHKLSKSGKSACVSIKKGLTSGMGTVGYVDGASFQKTKKGATQPVDPNYVIEERSDKDGNVMAHTNEETGVITPFNYFVWL